MTQEEQDALEALKTQQNDEIELEAEIVNDDHSTNTNEHETINNNIETKGQFMDALAHAASELDKQFKKQDRHYLGASAKTLVNGIGNFFNAYNERNNKLN